MSRAERRRLEKESKSNSPLYNYTQEQIKSIVAAELERSRKAILNRTTVVLKETLMVYSYYVLHNKFGFTVEDLEKYLKEVDSLADSVCQGYLNNLDLFIFCKEELGIPVDPSILHEVMESDELLRKKGLIK